MSDASNNLLNVLRKHFDLPDRKPIEEQVAACADAVMLDVAFSPVIEKPGSTETTEVTKRDDGSYALTYRNALVLDAVAYEPVSEADLKVMRARYLVTRGEKYKQIRSMPDDDRNEALRTFFPGGVWVPAENSELAAAMEMETSRGTVDRGPTRSE
jgi:hypothetical protein